MEVVVPEEFWMALRVLMPDAEVSASPGEAAWFPCVELGALDFGNRLFWTAPGRLPDMDYELEVHVRPGTLCARGTWLGANPPGGIALPEQRLWLADPRAFEITRVSRAPATGKPAVS